MIMRPLPMLCILGLAAALGGCQQAPGPHAPDFGNAVRQNIAIQTVNDAPDLAPAGEFDGTRAGLMMQRYKLDKVEPPKSVSTSDVGTAN